MSTIKSSDEHLTLNADGSSKDIKFQANGVEKASISSSGAFTSTTIDATKLTGDLPAISGAALTGVGVAGISSSADATAITIDSNENVGIGTTSPASVVNIKTTKTVALSTEANFKTLGLTIDDSTAYSTEGGGGGIAFRTARNSSGTQLVYAAIDGFKEGTANDGYTGALRFYTNNNLTGVPTEHMRINSDGDILMNTTSNLPADDNVAGVAAYRDGLFQISRAAAYVLNVNIKGTTGELIVLRKDGSVVGTISTNGSTTSYNTSSDYRLKENVDYTWDATTRLKQLKPARFNFIADDTNTLVDGFIAHEVSSVVPEAISGEKDAVDDDGNPVYQGIDQSKLVPLLVKTIQELEARIAALEA